MVPRSRARRAGLAAAVAAVPVAVAYRFALVYRGRAGFPQRHPPAWTPDSVGLAWEDVEVPTADGLRLPGWWMPADPVAGRDGSGDPAPAVLLVHGWESARDRTLGHAEVLHAAGFHLLAIDVRGHGANGPEALPLTVGEFAADARAGAAWLAARPDVSRVGMLGHSMGAAGVLVAAAGDPTVAAVVAASTPADPWRLTRQTFRLAALPIPGPVAWPLAWLTSRVYVRPRGHAVGEVSASRAVRSIKAPVLLVHGARDGAVPASDLDRLAGIRRAALPDAVTDTLLLPEGGHSWLYEFPAFRATVARFLARHLGGPWPPEVAAARAEAVPAQRLPDPERITTLDESPGGLRSLLLLVRRTPRRPAPGTPDTPSPPPVPRAGAIPTPPRSEP